MIITIVDLLSAKKCGYAAEMHRSWKCHSWMTPVYLGLHKRIYIHTNENYQQCQIRGEKMLTPFTSSVFNHEKGSSRPKDHWRDLAVLINTEQPWMWYKKIYFICNDVTYNINRLFFSLTLSLSLPPTNSCNDFHSFHCHFIEHKKLPTLMSNNFYLNPK